MCTRVLLLSTGKLLRAVMCTPVNAGPTGLKEEGRCELPPGQVVRV